MGKKSGPPAPDYTGAAIAEGQANQAAVTQQTWANRANQSNPWGSTTWTSNVATDPATGQRVTQWNENTTLDPRLQNALNSQLQVTQGRSDLANSLLPRAQQEFAQPMDWSNATAWASAPQAGQSSTTTSAYGFGGPRQQRVDTSRQATPNIDISRLETPGLDTSRVSTPTLDANLGAGAGDVQSGLDFTGAPAVGKAADTRARAEQAIYDSASSRLNPQWDQRRQSLESDLAVRGISMNSDAYSRAMADFDRSRNDAYAQAQMNAITGGGAEAQRDYGMDLGLRQQYVGEQGQMGNFANAAQQQDFSQRLGAGQANNAALQSQFGMGLQGQQQQNAALQSQFGLNAQAQQLQNEAMGQAFGFGNTARQTQLGAQQQAYNQSLQSGQYDLARQQQAFGQQQQVGAQDFNQQLAAAQFQNQTRQNQIAEAMQQRGFSLNEINALMSGQQVGMPQFSGYSQAGQAQAPDLLNAASMGYQSDLNRSNAQNANNAQTIGALSSIAMMMFSDRRVKADIRRIGTHRRGFGIYAYRYIGERGRRVGVIAQEVRRVAPELVHSVRGVLQVNYAGI